MQRVTELLKVPDPVLHRMPQQLASELGYPTTLV